MKKLENRQRREVIKSIFFSFIVTLPIFNTIFKLFNKKRGGRKPTPQELYRSHNLAG